MKWVGVECGVRGVGIRSQRVQSEEWEGLE